MQENTNTGNQTNVQQPNQAMNSGYGQQPNQAMNPGYGQQPNQAMNLGYGQQVNQSANANYAQPNLSNSNGYGQINQQNNAYQSNGYGSNFATPNRNPNPNKSAAKFVVFIMIFVFIAAFVLLALLFIIIGKKAKNFSEILKDFGNSATESIIDNDTDIVDSGNTSDDTDMNSGEMILPQSEYFQSFVMTVFDLDDYTDVTQEQLDSVYYLDLYNEDGGQSVTYYLTDDSTDSLEPDSRMYQDLTDLKCFRNLEDLYVSDELEEGDLDGLNNLIYVGAPNTAQELASIIPHPENLEYLGLYGSFATDGIVEGIDAFTNVNQLYVKVQGEEDLSPIAQLSNLTNFTLEDPHKNISDFAFLLDMTQLKSIYLDTPQLKTLDVLQNMDQLTQVEIMNTQIVDINSLEKIAPQLEYLYLYDDRNVKDLTPIANAGNLIELSLEVDWEATYPDFSNMQKLEYIYINGCYDLPDLTKATNLEEIYFDGITTYDFAEIQGLPNLRRLSVYGMNSVIKSVDNIAQLPALEHFYTKGLHFDCLINPLFEMNTMTQLSFLDDSLVIDFDTIPQNDNLEYLCFEKSSMTSSESWDAERIYFDDYKDVLMKFPNMQYLYLADTGISSLDFASGMSKLVAIDFANNNVTSIAPLTNLPDLQYVWYGSNTILDKDLMGDHVEMYDYSSGEGY